MVQLCLNEDGEASVELPPESPASDGEGEEGGEHESKALNATAVLLVRDYEIVSVALDVLRTSACGPGGSTKLQTEFGSSSSSHPISYRLTIFVSGGSKKTKMGHILLQAAVKPIQVLKGVELLTPKHHRLGSSHWA